MPPVTRRTPFRALLLLLLVFAAQPLCALACAMQQVDVPNAAGMLTISADDAGDDDASVEDWPLDGVDCITVQLGVLLAPPEPRELATPAPALALTSQLRDAADHPPRLG